MAGGGVRYIRIYCDDGHERYSVIAYGRLDQETGHQFDEGRSWVPDRVWIDETGQQRLARTHIVHPKQGDDAPPLVPGVPNSVYQYRFRCALCGFDEQRKYGAIDIDQILDRLSKAGVTEISVKAFVRVVWG